MKQILFLFSFAILFTTVNCSKEVAQIPTPTPQERAPLQIRIKNNTSFALKDIKFMEFNVDTLDFGALNPKDSTAYIAIDSIQFMSNYPLQTIRGNTDSKAFCAGIMGYCPVGETFQTFVEGDFTYVISEFPAGYIQWDSTCNQLDVRIE